MSLAAVEPSYKLTRVQLNFTAGARCNFTRRTTAWTAVRSVTPRTRNGRGHGLIQPQSREFHRTASRIYRARGVSELRAVPLVVPT